jgi:hypothetical protein
MKGMEFHSEAFYTDGELRGPRIDPRPSHFHSVQVDMSPSVVLSALFIYKTTERI